MTAAERINGIALGGGGRWVPIRCAVKQSRPGVLAAAHGRSALIACAQAGLFFARALPKASAPTIPSAASAQKGTANAKQGAGWSADSSQRRGVSIISVYKPRPGCCSCLLSSIAGRRMTQPCPTPPSRPRWHAAPQQRPPCRAAPWGRAPSTLTRVRRRRAARRRGRRGAPSS